MPNLGLGMSSRDIVVLFIVLVLLGGIIMTYWLERVERKALRRRLEREGTQEPEKTEEKRRAA